MTPNNTQKLWYSKENCQLCEESSRRMGKIFSCYICERIHRKKNWTRIVQAVNGIMNETELSKIHITGHYGNSTSPHL